MNRNNLKETWGKYCDIDKLVEDIFELFDNNKIRYTEHGVCTILNEYFMNKSHLIKLFEKSHNYIGDMRIAVLKDFKKRPDKWAVNNFCSDFPYKINANKMIIKNVDKNGKKISDYMKVGYRAINAKELLTSTDKIKDIRTRRTNLNAFDTNGNVKETVDEYHHFLDDINIFKNKQDYTFKQETKLKEVTIPMGMKTSRAFNKVCVHYGVDKAPEYNKLFAKYADMVTDSKRKLHFIISLNPLDYLTMSIGESWSSCHSIASGGCRVGCMSYMLDTTSIVTYVVTDISPIDSIHKRGKIYREMFHCSGTTLLQSRIYPQGNDGCTDLYSEFRQFVIEQFSELFSTNSQDWESKSGVSSYIDLIEAHGRHYPDYRYHNECTIFNPVRHLTTKRIPIGHNAICPVCGGSHNESSNSFVCGSCLNNRYQF